MIHRNFAVVRWTHLPTGVTAQADGYPHARNIRDRVRWASAMARKLLLGKLCRSEVAPIRRSYHIDPWPGVPSFIEQGGVKLAVGREAVLAVLAGRIPEPAPCPTDMIGR